jgi:hypothetical protein
MSVIRYQRVEDLSADPAWTQRDNLAKQMFIQGKTASYPNLVHDQDYLGIGKRLWVDHAAAQEFIDFAIAQAATDSLTLTSTEILDL